MSGNEKLDLAIKNMVVDYEKMKKQLMAANTKLETIKNALPDYRITAGWGSGAKTFIDKVKKEVQK